MNTSFNAILHGLATDQVIRFLSDLLASGCLRVANDGWVGEVVFDEGKVVGASFGAEQGRAALEAIMFVLPTGHCRFVSGTPPEARTSLQIGQAELATELALMRAEREAAFLIIPSLTAVPRVSLRQRTEPSESVVLDHSAIQTVLAVDGHRAVTDIATDRGVTQTVRDLMALVDAGLVHFSTPMAPALESQDRQQRVGPLKALLGLFVHLPGSPPATQRARAALAVTLGEVREARSRFAALSSFVYRRRWLILAAGLAFAGASAVHGLRVVDALKTGGFADPHSESTLADEVLHRQLGEDDGTLLVLFSARDEATVDSPEFHQAVETTLAGIGGQPGIGRIMTYYTAGERQFVSGDGHSTYATVGLEGDDAAQVALVKKLRPQLTSDYLRVQLGGIPAVSDELTEQVSKDLEMAERTTFPIVGLLLLIIFRSVTAALLPLALGGTAILGAFLALRVVTQFTDMSLFALNIISMLGLGLAIDYSLFMVSRFREELWQRDGDVQAALHRTMETAGRTVLFSGLTVITSLLSLLVFAPMFLKSMGVGGALAVSIAMLAALTLLPAMLAILGPKVDALSVWSLLGRGAQTARTERIADGSSPWYRVSSIVMRHPGVVLLSTLVSLIWIGLPFLHAAYALPDARSLPQSHESRQVADVLAGSFPRNVTQPIIIVVHTPQPALAPASLDTLFDYTRQVAAVPGVSRVDGLVTIDAGMDKAAYAAFYSEASLARYPSAAQQAGQYARGSYSLVSVSYDDDPYAQSSQNLVRTLRQLSVPAGVSVQITGEPAYLVDLVDSLARSIPAAIGLIGAVMLVLLFAMLGSLLIPLKAIVVNLLSLSASFGALVWVFQDGHFTELLGSTRLGRIDSTLPVLIFATAFGLSMDYEVFLLSRIKESYDQTQDMVTSVGLSIQKTGSIITNAAMLLLVVIGSFAAGEVVFIKQLGVGLAFAILVDATLVRMLLVPATMRLLGAYNWWAPGPLRAIHRRLGMSEIEGSAALTPDLVMMAE